jgi:hypothetical protein
MSVRPWSRAWVEIEDGLQRPELRLRFGLLEFGQNVLTDCSRTQRVAVKVHEPGWFSGKVRRLQWHGERSPGGGEAKD